MTGIGDDSRPQRACLSACHWWIHTGEDTALWHESWRARTKLILHEPEQSGGNMMTWVSDPPGNTCFLVHRTQNANEKTQMLAVCVSVWASVMCAAYTRQRQIQRVWFCTRRRGLVFWTRVRCSWWTSLCPCKINTTRRKLCWRNREVLDVSMCVQIRKKRNNKTVDLLQQATTAVPNPWYGDWCMSRCGHSETQWKKMHSSFTNFLHSEKIPVISLYYFK